MALANLASSVSDSTPWRTCQVCHALATIPKAEADGLRDLLRSGLRYSKISELIAADADTPLNIPRDALSRHARGLCEAREKLR
jgi:hypothetical protein